MRGANELIILFSLLKIVNNKQLYKVIFIFLDLVANTQNISKADAHKIQNTAKNSLHSLLTLQHRIKLNTYL